MKIADIGYRSPVIRWNPVAQVEIFERRNTRTGEVSFQDPSAAQVKALEFTSGQNGSSENVSSLGAVGQAMPAQAGPIAAGESVEAIPGAAAAQAAGGVPTAGAASSSSVSLLV